VLPFSVQTLIFSGSAFAGGGFFPFAAFFLHFSELFFLLALALAGFSFARKNLPVRQQKLAGQFFWLVLPLSFLSLLSILFAAEPVFALLDFLRLISLLLISGLLATGFFEVSKFVKIFVLTICLQAGLGIAQFLLGHDLGLQLLGESNFTADTLNLAKISLEGGQVVRGLGTLPHANILGGLLAIGVLLLPSREKKSPLAYAAGLLLLVGLFFTFSRAAWLAVAVGFLVLLFFQFRRRVISIALAGLIFAGLIFSFPAATETRLTETVTADLPRIEQLQIAGEIAQQNLLGVGVGQYSLALAEIRPDLPAHAVQPVHNFFALEAVEKSLLVALAWVFVFVFLARSAFQARQISALSVLAGLLVLANFDHFFTTNFAGEGIFILALGWIFSVANSEKFV